MSSIASDDDQSSTTSSSTTSDGHPTSSAEDLGPAPGTDTNERRGSVADVVIPVVAEEDSSGGDYGLQGKDEYIFATDFDVVTIHGLHGHREKTWQARDESKREAIRGLADFQFELSFRLMNYGYDTFKTLSKEGIDEEASKLLREVAEARVAKDKDSFRAIVFVCHDIGGAIVKQALYQSVMDSKYADIAESTKWIIFIGYPHRWHSLFDMEEKIARLVFSGSKLPQGNSLLHVKSLAKAVIECNLVFLESKILLNTEILSVRSTLEDLNECIFNEFDATLRTGFDYGYKLHQPHAALPCAEELADFKSMFEDFKEQLNLSQGVEERAEESSYMNALVAQTPVVRPVLFNRSHSNPLASNQQYINWRKSTDNNVLIIQRQSPMPWLSEFVFKEKVIKPSIDGIWTYFSFDESDDRYNSTRSFLLTTATQWVREKGVLKSGFDFQNDVSRFRAQRTLSENDLLVLLSRTRYFYVKGETVFVLNNLDECADKLSSFWRFVADLSESREKPWKFLIFTKSIDSLDEWLKSSPTIVLEDDFSLDDVDPCVRDEIDYALHQLDARYASRTPIRRYRDDLLKKCSNNMGLTRLLVQDLRNCESLETLTNTLENLANINLEVLFRRAMSAIPEAKRSLVARAITWVLFAFRPISAAELHSALCITEKTQDVDGMGAMNALIGIPIFDFSNTQEVRFQHAELKSLILQSSNEWYDVQANAHEMMAEVCLTFLGTTPAHDDLNIFCDVQHGVLSTPIVGPRVDLATYAICYWKQHYCLAPNKSLLIPLVLKLFQSKTTFRNWQMAHWFMANPFSRVDRTYLSELPLLASTGLEDIYERWIEDNNISPADQKLWLPYAVAEAARNRHGSLVLHLLQSVELDSTTAEYVLDAACSGGNEDVIINLMSHIRKTLPSFTWPAFLVHRSSWSGHARVVRALIDDGADISGSEGALFGQCSLHVAARNGHLEVVKLLVNHDEKLANAVDAYNTSVLFFAAQRGNAEMVKVLLKKGALPNTVGGIPISSACSVGAPGAVRVLLDHGAQTEPEPNDEGGWPPLHMAIDDGALGCVQVLLEYKSDPNHECSGGTALNVAVTNNRLDMVKLLVEHGADVNKRPDDDTPTALHKAVSQVSGLSMVEYLLEKGAEVNLRTPESSPLFNACVENNVQIVRLLLEKGANVNEVCSSVWTPLHAAYKSGEVTRVLLEAGASVDHVEAESGRSPLFLAAEWGETDVVTALIEHHADVNLPYLPTDEEWMSGFTPLLVALKAGYGETARVLLEAGADINIKPANGDQPLSYANTTELLRMVLEFQPDLALEDRNGDTALNAVIEGSTIQLANVKLLVHAGSNVDTANTAGLRPLHKAINNDKLDIARFLLKRGANVNALAVNGNTPLHLACESSTPTAVRRLVDASADINLVTSYLGSPAQAACRRSSPLDSDQDGAERTILEMLRILFSDGSTNGRTASKTDVNVTGGLYGSALAAASYHATTPVLQFLLSLGATTDTHDQSGRCPIHLAAVRPTTANFAALRDANANLYARDNAGRTIVHFAVVSGNLDMLRCVLQATDGLLHAADDDGWTPLHYAARGTFHRFSDLDETEQRDQRKHEFVAFLIDQGADIRALSTGPDGKQWSSLKLANYHGAKQETLDLLTPKNNNKKKGMAWDEESHKSQKAFDDWPYCYCDGCLYKVSGIRYKCRDCWDFDFCYKCYANRDMLHPRHDWNPIGQEFEEPPEAQPEATNQDSDSDDDDTDSDSDNSSSKESTT